MRSVLVLFSGNSNPSLAIEVCSHLEVPLGRALVGRFSDGEVRLEIHENVRGKDIYLLQSLCPPVNENLMELLVFVDALRRASARRINAVIPYYGYGRQDQKDKPRVPIPAKLVADLLSEAGVDRVLTIDLHADQIEGFFRIPVDHLYGTDVLLHDIGEHLQGDEVVVAPDAGGVERARSFARQLGLDLAIMDHRGADHPGGSMIVGKVRGCRVIVLDDMVDTGGTLVRTAQCAEAAGAATIDAYCVHAVLSGDAVERIDGSPIRSLTVTDTIALPEAALRSNKLRTVSISHMLAEAIRRVSCEESVTSLFSGFEHG